MWECPVCNRFFRTKNQSHTCDLVNLGNHFRGDMDGSMKQLFDYLCDRISVLGEFRFEPVKSSILIKKKATFLSIKVKPNHLEILFFLDYRHDVFPIVSTTQISRNKIIHLVAIDSREEFDNIFSVLSLSHDIYFG